MREFLILGGFTVISCLLLVLGTVALFNPVQFVRLHYRIFGDPGEWFDGQLPEFLRYQDYLRVRRDRGLQLHLRLMGIGFMIGGGMFLWFVIGHVF